MKKGAAKTGYDRRESETVPDERIVNYMKERAGYARMVSCAVAVQLIGLAFYFGIYVLIDRGVVYSLSRRPAEVIGIVISIIVAVCLCVMNIMIAARYKQVYIKRPDQIAMRDAKEVVELAYNTARPVLIYKITYSLVLLTTSGIVYIILLMSIDNQFIAGLYGKIVCALVSALAVFIILPCVDRIACYRALLGQTHILSFDQHPDRASMFIVSAAVPISICVWYVFRFYGEIFETAWITFPIALLFTLAVSFLIKWSTDRNG